MFQQENNLIKNLKTNKNNSKIKEKEKGREKDNNEITINKYAKLNKNNVIFNGHYIDEDCFMFV